MERGGRAAVVPEDPVRGARRRDRQATPLRTEDHRGIIVEGGSHGEIRVEGRVEA